MDVILESIDAFIIARQDWVVQLLEDLSVPWTYLSSVLKGLPEFGFLFGLVFGRFAFSLHAELRRNARLIAMHSHVPVAVGLCEIKTGRRIGFAHSYALATVPS
jgi:hypothetical protein